MRKNVLYFILLMAFLLSLAIGQAAVWTPPNVNPPTWSLTGSTPNAVARWAAKNKVYYGFTHSSPDRLCLLVYDTDANGNITSWSGSRRYSVLPSKSTSLNTMVWKILVNTRDSKLYLGLASNDVGFTTDLAVYSLDANGEPTGSPTGYSSGNAVAYVQDMVLHPTVDRLYMVGYGDTEVHYYALTTAGVPTGSPGTITIGGIYGVKSVDLNTAGTKLYAGSYETLQSITLDASGNKTGSVITKTATGVADYLDIAATNNNVCFRNTNTGNLNYWDLAAANGDPTGNLVTTTRAVQAKPARLETNANLLLVEPVKITDAVTGVTGNLVGLKVCEYTVTTAGAVGTLQNNTATTIDNYDRCTANSLDGQTGPSIVSTVLSPVINRFKDIAVRYTLNSITVNGDVAGQYKLKDISATSDYLKFAYSSRWGKIYMTNPVANQIRTYNIAADTFASNISATTVSTAIAVDDNQTTYGRLYYARTNNSVDYRNLSSAGVPGTVVNNATGMAEIARIGINTVDHKAYLAGVGGTAGQVGTTEIWKLPTANFVRDICVYDGKNRVYVVTWLNGNSNLWVWKLNADGTLATPMTPTAYSDGLPTGYGSSYIYGVRVNTTLNKLYLSGWCETAGVGYIAVHDLNSSGDPNGTVNLITCRGTYGYTTTMELKSDYSYLYYGSSGDLGLYGVPLNTSTGLPNAGQSHYFWSVATGSSPETQIAIASDNLKVFGGCYPWDLTVYEMQANGQSKPAPTAQLFCASQTNSIPAMAIGTATAWQNLNTGLTGVYGVEDAMMVIDNTNVTAANIKVEVSTNAGTTVHKTSTLDTKNAAVTMVVPGYTNGASIAANVIGNCRTVAEYWANIDATKIPTPVTTAPTNFHVGDAAWILDGTAGGIDALMYVLKDLGINKLALQSGSTTMGTGASSYNKTSANANGINGFGGKNYEIPTMFDYNTEMMDATWQLNWWNTNVIDWVKWSTNCSVAEITQVNMHDEPGYYFPSRYDELESDNGHKDVFINYLKSINATASWFGLASWNYADVHCGRYSDISTTAKRRLYYWTCRYFAQSYSKAAVAAKNAVITATNSSVRAGINFNNFNNRWAICHPGEVWNNNLDAGPDACSGAPDWFDIARKNAVTEFVSESWCNTPNIPDIAFRGAMMRSAVRNSTNGMKMGFYMTGLTDGAAPNDVSYRVLSLIGHGFKGFENWCLGPGMMIYDNGNDGETWGFLQSFAKASNLVGQKQSVLYPGVPRTQGTVAILLSGDSQPWDQGVEWRYSHIESIGLYYALSQAGYPVDIIDERDIENGKLTAYAYKTLYVSGANMSSTAATNIVSWVNGGGTCVVMPGAGRYDQYSDALTTLYSQLGCTQGTVARLASPMQTWQSETKTTISVNAGYQTPMGVVSCDVYGQVAPLTVTTGTQIATMSGGGSGSAIVLKTYGSGRFMTYGFWPGNEYYYEPDEIEIQKLMSGYPADIRKILSAPANPNYGNATKYIASSVDMVEGLVLENATSGIGVCLFNWSQFSAGSTTITLDKTLMPTAVKTALNNAVTGGTLVVNSAKKGNLSYTNTTNNISFTLTLDDGVDVVTLTW